MKNIAIIRYPGSNCDIETMKYFSFGGNNCFYMWHEDDVVEDYSTIDLIVIPGGFAFGDREYDNATDNYKISPGTMAIRSRVTKIIIEANKLHIPILGICNGFQILTKLGMLPGSLELNSCGKFICKRVDCKMNYFDINYETNLYIANSYGKYIPPQEWGIDEIPFITYKGQIDDNIAGVCNYKSRVFGMMPHPERNNIDFKEHLLKVIFPNSSEIESYFCFDKAIKRLMFSEHISYKTTRRFLKCLPTKAPWVVEGPGENAGIVDIGRGKDGEEYCLAIRIESHNHPTFIDPFEGAATGVGGILRDIFTMGARPIALMDFLRFGTNDNSKYLLSGAIDGISYYSNCVGVPNIGGDCKLHNSFDNNPLVNACAVGLVKKKDIVLGHACDEDLYMIYVGSKTGNEGINGAAMASNTFVNSDINSSLKSNIQKSDPFLEKLLLEACCEITSRGLVDGMQDMGAGGLLCATMEVVKRGRERSNKNLGCTIDVSKVPIKYEMELHNILISESQERMLIVSKKKNIDEISNIFIKWNLEFEIIGKTNMSGEYTVVGREEDEILYTENMSTFNDIHDYSNGVESCPPSLKYPDPQYGLYSPPPEKLKNIELWNQYDSTVGNRTIKGPDQPRSHAILDLHEINKHLILSWGESLDECIKEMSNFNPGVKMLCAVNCLNYGDPKYSICDLRKDLDDLAESCLNHGVPIVGGNVSLYNTTDNENNKSSIWSTPIIVLAGLI